jgi:hypothetical protein
MISIVNYPFYLSGNILLHKYRQTNQIGSSGWVCDLYSWGTSAGAVTILDKVFSNFIQSRQANSWIVSVLGHVHSLKILPNSAFIYPTIRRCILLIALLNNPELYQHDFC